MSTDSFTNRFILVRHGAISAEWKGICYGCQDVPLCDGWMADSDALVRQLATLRPTTVFHSGLGRSSWLAERIFSFCNHLDTNKHLRKDVRLRERNFGDWEGRHWDEVYASDPDNFHGLIDKPDLYRPPGGETTTEMQRRVVQWFEDCRRHKSLVAQTVIAITHSGPIAALAGHLLGLAPVDWSPWMLGYGEALMISSPVTEPLSVEVRRGLQPGPAIAGEC